MPEEVHKNCSPNPIYHYTLWPYVQQIRIRCYIGEQENIQDKDPLEGGGVDKPQLSNVVVEVQHMREERIKDMRQLKKTW